MFLFRIGKRVMEGQHTSGNLFLKDVIGQGSECIVIRDYMAGEPAHKKSGEQDKTQKKCNHERRTGSAKRKFHRGLSKERFLLSYWKTQDCMLN